ncbi:MmcQ/YjbR family DNA-binding protein [Saccharothrix violaceirubra]|uniref:MmcQ/YjbR family DNA-binding protein n=1 Tax=Saccharothrix violaceirubra TaxID=413306 RepID=A0A7W7T659_9PSEU|nr:MmcQ/YjbR family DNA-binding protein [Saccharothrix violaceirubra]MBB4967046.1 hypothetical protein [Saccharothrix violaceirubra]
MATWNDVRDLVFALPGTTERPTMDDMTAWRVADKLLVWDRPLRRGDLEALGDDAPDGPVLAARVADFGIKEALLADSPDVYFTTPHFDRSAIVLVRLENIGVDDLEELITDAWVGRAPKKLLRQWESDQAAAGS